MSIYDNVVAGYKLNGISLKKTDRDEIVEKALRNVTLWDEVKDFLSGKARFFPGVSNNACA
jgi:phosphate transport system ATP-binding protein